MFNVAYGLGCNSKDDPTLIRIDKLVTAMSESSIASQFLVVSILFRCVHEKNLDFPIPRMCFQP